MFQSKSFRAITASLINRVRATTTRLTDFSVGSVARTMLEAPAQEIDELYQQMVAGLVEAVPVSVYRSFDFDRLPAGAAGGLVRVTVTSQPAPVLIAAGTLFAQSFSSTVYAAVVDATIAASDSFVDVPVVASVAGGASNLSDGTAFTLDQPPAGFLSAFNLVAFISGRDQETDDERKVRFNEFIRTLARGTLDAVKFGAREKAYLLDAAGNQTERVTHVSLVEPYLLDQLQPVGLVKLYVHNGTGGTSPALVARVVEILHGYTDAGGRVAGYKAAGVQVDVTGAVELPVNVSAALTPAPGFLVPDLVAKVTAAIAAYILALPIGAPCYRAELVALAMAVDGVANFVLDPASTDVLAGADTKLMPGAFAVA